MTTQDILKNYQLSRTVIRTRILEIFLQNKCALSESEIKDLLGAHCDRTTVYRSLKTFEKAGLVFRLSADDGLVKYLLSLDNLHDEQQEHDHLHFRCVNCNRMICLPETTLSPFQLPDGFVAHKTNFVVVGLCPMCRQKNKDNTQ